MGSGVQHLSERARWHELQSAVSTIVMGRPLGVDVRREVDQARRDFGSPNNPGLAGLVSLPRAGGRRADAPHAHPSTRPTPRVGAATLLRSRPGGHTVPGEPVLYASKPPTRAQTLRRRRRPGRQGPSGRPGPRPWRCGR